MTDKTAIFSFFSGAGFLDLGFDLSGKFQTVFANEVHAPFMEIYRSSREMMGIEAPKFGYNTGDILKLTSSENIKLLNGYVSEARKEFGLTGFIGGPPCPDFSVGGKNKGREGENGRLSGTYIDLICKVKPDFFLFENVKGLYRTAVHRKFFEELKTRLSKAGYVFTERLINSIEYGVPQDRDRIILIGFQKSVLPKISKKLSISQFDWMSRTSYKKEDIFDLEWPEATLFGEDSDVKIPKSLPCELTVEHWFRKNRVLDHPNANHYFKPQAGLSKFQEIKEGDDKKKSYKRLHRWRYSPTAAYGNNEVHLHPYKARRLSAAEALAVQSLPREFVIPSNITLTNMFKTIGNGVPFLAAQGLALTISDFIEHSSKSTLSVPNGKNNSPEHRFVHSAAI